MTSEQSSGNADALAPNTEFAEGATNARNTEKLEEEKLKAKYPAAAQGLRAPGGHSAFLQKRLQKGVCIAIGYSQHMTSLLHNPLPAKILRFRGLSDGQAEGRWSETGFR